MLQFSLKDTPFPKGHLYFTFSYEFCTGKCHANAAKNRYFQNRIPSDKSCSHTGQWQTN